MSLLPIDENWCHCRSFEAWLAFLTVLIQISLTISTFKPKKDLLRGVIGPCFSNLFSFRSLFAFFKLGRELFANSTICTRVRQNRAMARHKRGKFKILFKLMSSVDTLLDLRWNLHLPSAPSRLHWKVILLWIGLGEFCDCQAILSWKNHLWSSFAQELF